MGATVTHELSRVPATPIHTNGAAIGNIEKVITAKYVKEMKCFMGEKVKRFSLENEKGNNQGTVLNYMGYGLSFGVLLGAVLVTLFGLLAMGMGIVSGVIISLVCYGIKKVIWH